MYSDMSVLVCLQSIICWFSSEGDSVDFNVSGEKLVHVYYRETLEKEIPFSYKYTHYDMDQTPFLIYF